MIWKIIKLDSKKRLKIIKKVLFSSRAREAQISQEQPAFGCQPAFESNSLTLKNFISVHISTWALHESLVRMMKKYFFDLLIFWLKPNLSIKFVSYHFDYPPSLPPFLQKWVHSSILSFLRWQPYHFPVMAFCFVVLIYLNVFQKIS